MNQSELNKRLARTHEAFKLCLGENGMTSFEEFGVTHFHKLIDKTFYFFIKDSTVLRDKSVRDPCEAMIGKVTGIKFRFIAHHIEEVKEIGFENYLSVIESLSDVKGDTCFPFIQTTVGELSPPWDLNYWKIKLPDEPICEGFVLFNR